MDLAQAQETLDRENKGVSLPLLDRNGNPDLDSKGNQSSLTIVGEYSSNVGKADDSQTRTMWKRRPGSFDPAQVTRKNRIERAASAVIGWSGIEANGEPVPFSREAVVTLLTAAPWVLKQVEAAIESYGSFFEQPSSN